MYQIYGNVAKLAKKPVINSLASLKSFLFEKNQDKTHKIGISIATVSNKLFRNINS